MYLLTLSTPEQTNTFVSNRTHAALSRKWGWVKNGYAVYFSGVCGLRFVGTLINGKLVKG